MMERRTGLERFWNGCDNLLLLAVIVLLSVCLYSARQADAVVRAAGAKAGEPPAARTPRNMPSSGRTVDGLRVSLEGDRMNSIARSMVDTAWERVPACPAMDMREDGKSYEIFFALPLGFDGAKVRVTAQCGILTLAMASEENGSMMMQRFRIPCGVERAENIDTAISNNVLRVRIHPAPGN